MSQITITSADLLGKITEQASKIAQLELANAVLDRALQAAEEKIVALQLQLDAQSDPAQPEETK